MSIDTDYLGICKFEAEDDRYGPIDGNIMAFVDYFVEGLKKQQLAIVLFQDVRNMFYGWYSISLTHSSADLRYTHEGCRATNRQNAQNTAA